MLKCENDGLLLTYLLLCRLSCNSNIFGFAARRVKNLLRPVFRGMEVNLEAVWYHTIKNLPRQPCFPIFLSFPQSPADYDSYYRRKSCVFSLSTLSVFDAFSEEGKGGVEIKPNSAEGNDPAFPRFPQDFLPLPPKAPPSFQLYINHAIKFFYE